MTDQELADLHCRVIRLRSAIDRAKSEHPYQDELPFINHWPSNCCDAPYLFFLLYQLGHRGMIWKAADVSHLGRDCQRHVWMVLDGVTIDITADQFPAVTDKVIVTRRSTWHESLNVIEERPWAIDSEDALFDRHREQGNGYEVYAEILPQYAEWG